MLEGEWTEGVVKPPPPRSRNPLGDIIGEYIRADSLYNVSTGRWSTGSSLMSAIPRDDSAGGSITIPVQMPAPPPNLSYQELERQHIAEQLRRREQMELAERQARAWADFERNYSIARHYDPADDPFDREL